MNNSSIYDRRLLKETFKKIYNDKNNNYNLPLNNNLFPITKLKILVLDLKKKVFCMILWTKRIDSF